MKIRLAAQMQALAMALATKSSDLITSATLLSHPDAKKLGAQDHHAISALKVLYRIGKLEQFRTATGRIKYGYALPVSMKVRTLPAEDGPVTTTNESVAPVAPVVQDVKVTVSKSTGALYVEFKGLRIEISVKE